MSWQPKVCTGQRGTDMPRRSKGASNAHHLSLCNITIKNIASLPLSATPLSVFGLVLNEKHNITAQFFSVCLYHSLILKFSSQQALSLRISNSNFSSNSKDRGQWAPATGILLSCRSSACVVGPCSRIPRLFIHQQFQDVQPPPSANKSPQ